MSKNKNFISFIKGEPILTNTKVSAKIKLMAWMLPALFLVSMLTALLQIFLLKWNIIDPMKSAGVIPDYMKAMPKYRIILEIAILAPLLEETAFRGILQDNIRWLRVALFSISYLMICRLFGLNFYELTWPTACVLGIAGLSLLTKRKTLISIVQWIQQPNIRVWIVWCSALAFGMWHYYNFDFSQAGFITIIISLVPFVVNGLLFSYVAVKNGLFWSILLHVANNTWPLVLWL